MRNRMYLLILAVLLSLLLSSCMSFGFFNSRIETRKDVYTDKGHIVEQVVLLTDINVVNRVAAYTYTPSDEKYPDPSNVRKYEYTEFTAVIGTEQTNGVTTSRFIEFECLSPIDPDGRYSYGVKDMPLLCTDCCMYIGTKETYYFHTDNITYSEDPENADMFYSGDQSFNCYHATLRFELSQECVNSILGANQIELQFFTDPLMGEMTGTAEMLQLVTDQGLEQVKILLR